MRRLRFSLNKALTQAVRKELRQFGAHVTRCRIVDLAECRVFKLLTNSPDHSAMASAHFYT